MMGSFETVLLSTAKFVGAETSPGKVHLQNLQLAELECFGERVIVGSTRYVPAPANLEGYVIHPPPSTL